MASILKISSDDISSALCDTTRQYLVGSLGRPQALKHVHSDLVEIGITKYESVSFEAPHTHERAYEYQLVLSGKTEYMELPSGRVHQFNAGDFYVIQPGVTYAQRSAPKTEILFVKIPPGNDKVLVDATPEIQNWMNSPVGD
jgi:8-oxo-dGTP diphosphatase